MKLPEGSFYYAFLLIRAEYHVHISDMGVDECPPAY
jgi:hypothetical protein